MWLGLAIAVVSVSLFIAFSGWVQQFSTPLSNMSSRQQGPNTHSSDIPLPTRSPKSSYTMQGSLDSDSPTPLSDDLIFWTSHTSYVEVISHGYSVTYPKSMSFLDREGDIDFILENHNLRLAFVVAGLPDSESTKGHITPGFCLQQYDATKEETLPSGLVAYRSDSTINGLTCLDAVIAFPEPKQRWIIDIQATAKNQTGVALFDKILSTFRFSE